MGRKQKGQIVKSRFLQKALLVLGLFFLIISLVLALSYSNIYPSFIDKKIIFGLDSLVGSIPLLPKTPKQVITKSLFANKELNDYSSSGFVSLQSESGSNDNIKLSFKGHINKAGQFGSESSFQVLGSLSKGLSSEVNFETINKEGNFYFRTKGNLGIEGFDPSLLGQSWYQINLDKFQESLRVNAKSDRGIINDISQELEKNVQELVKNNFFSKLRKANQIQKGQDYYFQYTFTLPESILQKIEFLKNYSIAKSSLVVEINKKTFFLEKIFFEADLRDKNKKIKEKAILTLEYKITNLNKKKNISIPKNAKVLSHPIDLSFALAGKSKSEEEYFFKAATEAIEQGQNFLTIERILRVVQLLPKAVYSN